MPEVQEVFRMATQKVRPEPGFVDRQHDHRRKNDRNRKIGAFAVVAAIAVVVATAIVMSQPRNGSAPADGSSPTRSVDPTAIRSARDFALALGFLDAPGALTHLAPDADISALLFDDPEGAEGIAAALRLQVRMLEAQGFGQILGDCEQTDTSSSGTQVRCAFDFHSMGSDQLGLGPFTGSSYDFTIGEGGAITRASVSWDIEDFSPQVWEPFAEWVSTTYPDDAAVMYQDQTYSGQRLSEESIQLWARRVPEYVAAQTPKMVQVAQRFMEARNTNDVDALLALLPEGEALVHPMDDNLSVPNILTGRIRMDREQLALAFEAERLFQIRFDSVECRSEPSVHYTGRPIVCSYVLDSRLRQIAGIDPAPKSMRIGVQGGRIQHLSFPWLNVSFPGGQPAEGARFVEWVETAHPEVGGIQGGFHDGTLFRTAGQEVVLRLTPEAIGLLASYLDEYERAVG